jgi:hypothetical protein
MEMDIYMRRRLVALGGLVAFFIIIVLLIRSCGDDEEPAPLQDPTAGTTDEAGAVPLSTEDFIAQADQICGPANTAVGALDPESPTATRDEYRITADELEALQQLQVEEESRVLQQFFSALEDVVAALREKSQAIRDGDTVAEGEAQVAIDEAEVEARELGSRYGFQECGQFLDAGEQPGGGGAEGTEGTAPTDTVPAPTETVPAPTETTPAPTETTPAPTETTPAPDDSGGGISP